MSTLLSLDLYKLTYLSRLRILKISTLETRRADLLEVFKIINGLDSIFTADFFIMENEHDKKGHPYKISKLNSRIDTRKYSFTQRIVNDWNRHPGIAVRKRQPI